jgi:hypothetical protein
MLMGSSSGVQVRARESLRVEQSSSFPWVDRTWVLQGGSGAVSAAVPTHSDDMAVLWMIIWLLTRGMRVARSSCGGLRGWRLRCRR